MKTTLLAIGLTLTAGMSLWAQTENTLPGGILRSAVRALPAPETPSPDSQSKSNIAALQGVNTPRAIQPAPGGARVEFGLQKTFFPVDVKDGRVVITTPDGRLLSFRPTFLALHDVASGQSLLLAEVTNRIGAIVGPDEVTYTNAFDTLRADIRLRVLANGAGLEQDIVLQESFEVPKEFSSEVRLEIWTAWYDSEPVSKTIHPIDLRASDTSGLLTPSLADNVSLDFGTMKIVDGFAFSSTTQDEQTPVSKSWVRIDGQDWLVETVDYLVVKPKLDLLPKARRTASLNRKSSSRENFVRSLARKGEPTTPNASRMLLAQAGVSKLPQFVMDFVIVSSVPVPSGALSWWPGGGNTNDALSTNHATWIGTNTYAAGKVGQTFSFNGTNYLAVTNAAGLGPTNGLTVETWVWIPSDASGPRIITLKGTPNQWQYLLALDGPGNTVYAFVEGGYYVSNAVSLTSNTWHHVAMTYDASSDVLSLYLNGQPEQPGSVPDGLVPNSDPFYIGGNPDATYPWQFTGRIDEPTVYNRVLGASEILAIFNAGAAGKHNPNCITAPTNIVAWWPGDDNGYDLARTNFAVLNAGAAYGAARVSDGFSFDGSDDYVEIPNAPDLNPTNAITLEAWVYQTTNQYQNAPIFSKDEPNTTRQYLLTVADSGKFRAHVWRNPGGIAYFDGITTVELNTWYHVAMTYDGTTLLLYVNGIADAGLAATGSIVTGTEPLRIGGSYSGVWGNYKFAGLIDEPTVYDRALTSSEITALYSSGSAGKCKIDTDGDGLTDLQEQFLSTGANDTDSDNDGLTDGDEVFVHHSDPLSPDTDGDGVIDGTEVLLGRNPKVAGTVADTGSTLKLKVFKPSLCSEQP